MLETTNKRRRTRSVDLEIVELSSKGNGVGYTTYEDGTVVPVEVPFAVPGDCVCAQLLPGSRGGKRQSFLEEIIDSSADRISPRCKHFSSCGGCRWQQLSYEKRQNRQTCIQSRSWPNTAPEPEPGRAEHRCLMRRSREQNTKFLHVLRPLYILAFRCL